MAEESWHAARLIPTSGISGTDERERRATSALLAIRYLEHPKSGALDFSDMGPSWVPVRESVGAGTLRPADAAVPEIAGRFDALVRYAGLRLGRQLGTDVVPALTRKEQAEPAVRTQALVAQLATTGTMTAALRIPGAVGTLSVTADLRAAGDTDR